MNPHNFTSLCG